MNQFFFANDFGSFLLNKFNFTTFITLNLFDLVDC